QHIALDRPVTFNRNTLSGGEFQRLALARLMLREASIWLLDEPTTALDIENTKDVMRQINLRERKKMKDVTIIGGG
ncbi:hypothetical protein DD924_21040, partial [Staphylococcus pseudintermedius]